MWNYLRYSYDYQLKGAQMKIKSLSPRPLLDSTRRKTKEKNTHKYISIKKNRYDKNVNKKKKMMWFLFEPLSFPLWLCEHEWKKRIIYLYQKI